MVENHVNNAMLMLMTEVGGGGSYLLTNPQERGNTIKTMILIIMIIMIIMIIISIMISISMISIVVRKWGYQSVNKRGLSAGKSFIQELKASSP